MSNRYFTNNSSSSRRQDGYKGKGGGGGGPKTQNKLVFVQKTTPGPTTSRTEVGPTLSNALRQSLAASSSGGSASAATSANKVRLGESGGDKIPSGKFPNYLPQDEAVAAGLGADEGGLDPVESQRVVDLLNRELSRLLKLNSRDFWREVATDASLQAFLQSFLKFRSRWYDFPYRGVQGIVAGVIVGEYDLSRRVFMVFYRISSNRDPGARAADSLSPKDHAVLLQDKQLLDLPKLLDICAIYAHENEDLTRLLIVNAIKAQPRIHDDLTAVLSHFLSIVNTMYQRCISSLEVLFSSTDRQNHGSSQLHEDYLEVMDFINDAIVSMDAFVSAYKNAAVFFSCPVELSFENEGLLGTLAKLHDSLLPSLQRGFKVIFAAREDGPQENFCDMISNIALSLKMLSTRIVKFGWKILYCCYLSDEVFEYSSPLPSVTKIFPAKVEDPVIRADILVQTFREISEGLSYVQEGKGRGTFLQNVEKNHKLMTRIILLRNNGWILMDDEQFKFLSGIMKHPLGDNISEISYVPTAVMSTAQMDEGNAILESKLSQIKELFPEYGRGFLSACLEVYNQNPEEVIQRILEGTLHKDLQSLDTALEMIPPKAVSSITKNDKGKGKLVEYTAAPSTNRISPVSELQTVGPSVSSSSTVGRFVRKSTVDLPDSETLDCRDEEDFSKTAALVSQLEYEDEYDDSFDDLGLSVADSGVEETEELGGRLNSNRGKSWQQSETGTSASDASKWGSRKQPQFFVKDGKNYSYKVAGSVAVANYNEASIVNQSQKELIHGLGHGGNFPLGAASRLISHNKASNEDQDMGPGGVEVGGRGNRGNSWGRGSRQTRSTEEQNVQQPGGVDIGGRANRGNSRGRGSRPTSRSEEPNGEQSMEPGGIEVGGQDNPGNSRGRGRRGGGRNHNRRDQAMRKHFAGLGGR